MFSCRTSGDQNEGTHPELLLMLKAASQCHKHDCIKHAPLITLSKVLGFFRKTESKCAICTTLLLEMWWKRQWKGKKKALNVVITVLLGLLSPPCFLLPTAQTSSRCCHSEAPPLLHREMAEMQDFFPLKVGFSLSEQTAPQPQGLEDSWFLHTSSTINNGLTTSGSPPRKQYLWPSQVPTNPKLRWLRYDWRYDW